MNHLIIDESFYTYVCVWRGIIWGQLISLVFQGAIDKLEHENYLVAKAV